MKKLLSIIFVLAFILFSCNNEDTDIKDSGTPTETIADVEEVTEATVINDIEEVNAEAAIIEEASVEPKEASVD